MSTVMLRHKDGKIAMPIEVHTEDDHEWGGYNLANPLGGFRTYTKAHYVIVPETKRRQVSA